MKYIFWHGSLRNRKLLTASHGVKIIVAAETQLYNLTICLCKVKKGLCFWPWNFNDSWSIMIVFFLHFLTFLTNILQNKIENRSILNFGMITVTFCTTLSLISVPCQHSRSALFYNKTHPWPVFESRVRAVLSSRYYATNYSGGSSAFIDIWPWIMVLLGI